MLTLTGSAAYVALVQTAAGLPVVLFAIVAGTIGDLVDRRRFLLVTETLMLVAAAALGALAIAGLVTPWVLLALVFAVGTGQALTSPTWQTLQPELVSPAERTQAISLGSVNQNLARAVGPAIGGVLLAATSAGTVFLVNAVSFVAVIGGDRGLAFRPRPGRAAPGARRRGGPGRRPIHRGQPGAAGDPGPGRAVHLLRQRHLGAAAADRPDGAVPGFRRLRARGMSFYLIVFQGGNAIASAVMGLAAENAGLTPTLTIAAAGLALGPLAALGWRFRPIPPEDLLPAATGPRRTCPRTRRQAARCWSASSTGRSPDSKIS